jgi:phosphoribosylglycinamide formyltransferase 1
MSSDKASNIESETNKPKVLVFTSDAGRGFEALVKNSLTHPPILKAKIVGVVSNHEKSRVKSIANEFNIPYEFWNGPFDDKGYQGLVKKFEADYVMLSDWYRFVTGLDSARTISIHPGPLPVFGGKGMFGHHINQAVFDAYLRSEVIQSEVTIHYIAGADYDEGPVISRYPVPINKDDTFETLNERVNQIGWLIQSVVLNAVVNGKIYLKDGKVFYPEGFPFKA